MAGESGDRQDAMRRRGQERDARLKAEAAAGEHPPVDMRAVGMLTRGARAPEEWAAARRQGLSDAGLGWRAVVDESRRRWLLRRVEQGMEEHGLTDESLAKLAGLDVHALRRRREGKVDFSWCDVLALADVFRVPVTWFCRGTQPLPWYPVVIGLFPEGVGLPPCPATPRKWTLPGMRPAEWPCPALVRPVTVTTEAGETVTIL